MIHSKAILPLIFLILSTACTVPHVSDTPTATSVPSSVLPTETPSPKPTETQTTTPEPQKFVEVAEENREAINAYLANIIWGINEDQLQTILGIETEQEFVDYLKEHNWTLPANDSTKLKWFLKQGSTYESYILRETLNMDKPFVIAPEIQFIAPSQIPGADLSNQLFTNIDFSSPEEKQFSVSVGFNFLDQGDYRELAIQVVRRSENLDMLGRRFDGDNEKLKTQANDLVRKFLTFVYAAVNFDTSFAANIATQNGLWSRRNPDGSIDDMSFYSFFYLLRNGWDLIPPTEMPPEEIFR